MPNLDDTLRKLQKAVLGSSDIDQIDELSKLALKLRKEIPDNISNFLSHIIDLGDKKIDIEQELDFTTVTIYPEYKRIYRYKEYRAIAKLIPYVRRALHVITQNIISPDDYTKTVFNMVKFGSSMDSTLRRQVEEILQHYKFDMLCYDIIYNTLLYGDAFVEIVDEKTIKQLAKVALKEQRELKAFAEAFGIENGNSKLEITLELDFSPTMMPKSVDFYDKLNLVFESKKKKRMKDIKLVQHFPGNVIILGTRDFVLGYLVFIEDLSEVFTTGNIKQMIGPNKYSSTMSLFSTGLPNQFDYDRTVKSFLSDLADRILGKIFAHYNIKNQDFDQLTQTIENSKKELTSTLYTLIYMKTAMRNEVTISSKIRFVPADKMVHFKLLMGSESAFLPYGTSKLYGLEYIARALIALETSIILYRITRSVDRRIYHIERGASRDVQGPIQQVVRALTKRRYGVFGDQIGVDEIPSHISSLEEIFMPMDNGKRYIEVDTLQPGNLNVTMEDWRELRDALVSGLEVPPAYLALEQNYETRGTLSSENVVFASTILSYQREFGELFTELLRKLYYHKYGTHLTKDVVVEFRPPIKLLLERYSEMASSYSQLAEVAKTAGIDPLVLFKRFFGELIEERDNLEISIEKFASKLLGGNQQQGEMGGGLGGVF